MNCHRRSVLVMVMKPMLTRVPRCLPGSRIIAAVAAGQFLLAACSGPAVSRAHPTSSPRASASLPDYSQAVARLKPCDSVSTAQLSSIIGKPVHIDETGNVGQKPFLSSGPVLPEVWIATCSWIIPAYPTTSLYLQMELAPSPAGALIDFNGMRSKMGITQAVTHEVGYGEAAVFATDTHGDVIIIVIQGARIVNLQFNSTSQPAPSDADRIRMAKSMTRLIMQGQ
jgi:hypothetical protein